MRACKNSKPQGLDEHLKHELLKTDRTMLTQRGPTEKSVRRASDKVHALG